jgi:hypothetical protein
MMGLTLISRQIYKQKCNLQNVAQTTMEVFPESLHDAGAQ